MKRQLSSLLVLLLAGVSPLVACSFLVDDSPAGATDDDTLDGGDGGLEPSPDDGSPDGDGSNDGDPTDTPDAGPLPETPSTPTNLQVFTGGNNIALRWTGSVAVNPIQKYNIYRDGTLVAEVTPSFHADFPEKNGNGWIDNNVTAGQTYGYRVEAVDTQGRLSEKSAVATGLHPATVTAVPALTLTTDAETKDLEPWMENTLRPLLLTWYPKLALRLGAGAQGYNLPNQVTVVFNKAVDGGVTRGNLIELNPDDVRANPNDMGLVLHLMLFVIQNYPGGEHLWLTTSISQWAREFLVHDIDPTAARLGSEYLDGYFRGSAFLNWIQTTHGPADLIARLNVARNANTYTDALIQTLTGKTVRDLWIEYTGASYPGRLTLPRLTTAKCVHDGWDNVQGSGTDKAQLFDCAPDANSPNWTRQRWGVRRLADDTVLIGSTHGGCLTLPVGETASGTLVFTRTCSGNDRQKWKPMPNGTLVNALTGRCLDNPQNTEVNGTQLRILDCITDSPSQVFTLPQ